MASETDTLPLIRTKLSRPRITGALVPRPRDRPLTLVAAPAGYGKTTLVTSWLATCDCRSAWLALDEGDSDLALFLSHFPAVDLSAVPDIEYEALKMLVTFEEQPREQAVSLWLAALNPERLKIIQNSPLGKKPGRERTFFKLEHAVETYPGRNRRDS